MDYERLVTTLRSGRVEAHITLGQSRNGLWYYNTRVFRPFTDAETGETKKAYLYGYEDMPGVIDVATRAEAWITNQLESQKTVRLGREEAA